MKDLIIVGHSGFSREIGWLIKRINEKNHRWNLCGFVDTVPGENVVGDDEYLLNRNFETDVVIAIGDTRLRALLYDKFKNNKYLSFPSVIDPSVQMSDSVKFGYGNIICAGSILTVDISLGDFNIINLDCTIGHEARIRDFVTLNPSVNVSGMATIQSYVNIGTGTQVLQGRTIGDNTVIGAGAVVNKDIPSNCTAVGIPAKVIKRDE